MLDRVNAEAGGVERRSRVIAARGGGCESRSGGRASREAHWLRVPGEGSSPTRRPIAMPASRNSPSETTRAVVSAVLLLYLVGLALSIAGNTASGSSVLVRTLKGRLFAPWLAPAWLDLGFDNRLTWGLPEDGDHVLEIRGRSAAAERGPVVRRWPDGLRGDRAARWRRLARAIAVDGEQGDAAGTLAAAAAAGGFAAVGGDDVTLRVLRHPLPERGVAAGGLEQVYAARVRRVGGEVQLLRSEERGAVAPLVGERATP